MKTYIVASSVDVPGLKTQLAHLSDIEVVTIETAKEMGIQAEQTEIAKMRLEPPIIQTPYQPPLNRRERRALKRNKYFK